MTNSRFGIDLSEVSTERLIVPAGTYEARVAKAELRSGVKDERNWAMINVTYAIRDPEVAKLLNQDEPKVFGTIGLSFDKDTEKFSKNNPDFGALMATLGLTNSGDIFEEGTEVAETQWEYNKIYFTNVANTLAGYDLLINVAHRKAYNDPSRMEAAVTKVAKLEG
jgi:hypothetical protein